jgi:hypothetical protein
VREIRTLRAMWRALEKGPRQFLTGHEEGNLGYKPRRSLRATAPVLDPTSRYCTAPEREFRFRSPRKIVLDRRANKSVAVLAQTFELFVGTEHTLCLDPHSAAD